jgi:hypothetical protein
MHDVSTLDFGAAGAYLRFLGDVTVERDSDGILDAATDSALWELLYFGERAAPPDGGPKAPAEMVIGHQA